MKRMMFLLLIGVLIGDVCLAQENFMISGRIHGLSVSRIYVVSADFGKVDTLTSTIVRNGQFVLSGILPGKVRAVNLIFPEVNGKVPLLLENVNYQVSVTAQNVSIKGEGPAARLCKEFERIAHDYIVERNRMGAEYRASEGDMNEAKVQYFQTRLDSLYRQFGTETQKLIKSNADSYVSAYVIASRMFVDDEATLRSKYEQLGPVARNSVPGKAIAATLECYERLVVGKKAPNFTTEKPDGNTFSLHDLPAKLKLVYFWVSTNPLCRQDNTDLVKLYLQYRPQGLEIVSISLDENRGDWRNAVGQDGMVWTNGSDLQGFASPIARLYMVHELPATFLVDAENRIVAKGLRGDALRDTVAKLLKKSKRK